MKPFSWRCPFCNHNAIVTDENFQSSTELFKIMNADGPKCFSYYFIVCPNPDCKKFVLSVGLQDIVRDSSGNPIKKPTGRGYDDYQPGKLIRQWRLIPESAAKVFPPYIPMPILDDYREACLIKDLSPKASATLSRRCLQGMIRDFWGVSGKRLVDEIEAIKDKVDPDMWQGIDAVRKIGNIGAHMEADINLIIDVDPDEADMLIKLIETLLEDWYINRHERQEHLKNIKIIADKKEKEKKP